MAAVADHSSPSEEVEKEQVKKIDTECASDPPKEPMEAAKPVESAAPSDEAEAKIEEKQIDPHAKDSCADEEPKIVVSAPTEEKVEDKPVEDDKKTEEAKSDILCEEKSEAEPDEKQVVDVPESLPAEKKEEKVEEPPAQVVEATESRDVAVPEATEEVKKETPADEPVKEVEAKSCTDKAEDAELPKEEETSPVEAPVSQVDEKSVEVCGKTDEGIEQTEPAKESVEVKLEEKAAEPEDSKTSVPTPEPVEKVATNESVPDNGIEKCGTEASPETTEEVKETTKEVEKSEAPEKIEEAAEAKLVEEKQVDEKIKETVEATEVKLNEETKVEKCKEETNKGSDDIKTTQEVPKEDVPVKTQKQSIVKIVKQSLVKAKKAIIGKSHNSKTPAPEAKEDDNK